MPAELFANTPTPGSVSPLTSLSGNGGSITSTATSIKVAAAAPTVLQGSGQFRILIDSEIMLVTGGANSTTWTVTRGNNLLSPDTNTNASHNDGAQIYHVWTAGGVANGFAPANLVSTLGTVSGNVNCDLSQAICFTATISGNATFAFINWPIASVLVQPLLIITEDTSGGHSISITGVTWLPSGATPTFTTTASSVNVIPLFSANNGSTLYGWTSLA